MDDGEDSERRLTARRRITNKMLLLNTVMFGIGLFAAISDGGIVLWFGVVFFGCGLVLFVVDRIRRTTLAIDRYSVTVIGPFGGRKSYEIANCGPFGVLHQTVGRRERIDWLTFDYQGKHPRTWLQRASAKMAGANTQLRVDGYEYTPVEIAELLNSYRDAAHRRLDA